MEENNTIYLEVLRLLYFLQKYKSKAKKLQDFNTVDSNVVPVLKHCYYFKP